MGKRAQLQVALEALIGSTNVYFQPPETVKLKYPCVIYERNSIKTKFADDNPYNHQTKYQVTVIDKNPDSDLPQKIGGLPMCSFDRHYTSDNLNHDVYNLYY
jgi:hypothetical protein